MALKRLKAIAVEYSNIPSGRAFCLMHIDLSLRNVPGKSVPGHENMKSSLFIDVLAEFFALLPQLIPFLSDLEGDL